MIQVTNVSKTFLIEHEKRNTVFEYLTSLRNPKGKAEKLEVLKNISFSVEKGEMLGIVGFNGSGKSTLLKIMAKIMEPDSGSVVTGGKIIPFLSLGTGYNGELTAKDNIILNGVILGFTKNEISSKIDKIIKFAELEKFLDTKIKNFSSGMMTRLAFSTAMEVDPDILIVDEILAVGDIAFQEKSFDAFMKFRKSGKTIVYVSHDINQISQLCDKALWLHEGSILSYGLPREVTEKFAAFAKAKNENYNKN